MNKVKKALMISTVFLILVVVCLFTWHVLFSEKSLKFTYYYEEGCGSCDGTKEFNELLKHKAYDIKTQGGYELEYVNTFKNTSDKWNQTCDRLKLPKEKRVLPMLVCDTDYITGNLRLNGELRSFLCKKLGITDNRTIYYYYRPDCGDCARVDELIKSTFEKFPEISLVKIDTTDPEPKVAFKKALSEQNIPKDEWQVPFIWNNQEYLSGDKKISENLESYLKKISEEIPK